MPARLAVGLGLRDVSDVSNDKNHFHDSPRVFFYENFGFPASALLKKTSDDFGRQIIKNGFYAYAL